MVTGPKPVTAAGRTSTVEQSGKAHVPSTARVHDVGAATHTALRSVSARVCRRHMASPRGEAGLHDSSGITTWVLARSMATSSCANFTDPPLRQRPAGRVVGGGSVDGRRPATAGRHRAPGAEARAQASTEKHPSTGAGGIRRPRPGQSKHAPCAALGAADCGPGRWGRRRGRGRGRDWGAPHTGSRARRASAGGASRRVSMQRRRRAA